MRLVLLLLVAGSRLVLAVAGSAWSSAGAWSYAGCWSADFLVSWCAIAPPTTAPAMSARRRVRRLKPMENSFPAFPKDTSRYARPWPIDLRSPPGTSPPRNGAGCIPRNG